MSHKNLVEKYQKKNPLEHILDLPDTYIGSVEKSGVELWIFDKEENRMIKKTINIVYGLYKIFDEIIVNVIDQHTRLKQDAEKGIYVDNHVTIIKVNIDPEKNEICVYNNGVGIPIAVHPKEKIYVPEMIFGNLLTSENYNKKEKKIVGGKNGYGAKLTNIFSTKFVVETVDAITGKKYVQNFYQNMTKKDAPKITSSSLRPYTKITFYPDLARFGMNKLDDDILSLMEKRVYDMTACTDKTCTVFYNNQKIDCKLFEKYMDMFLGNSKTDCPRVYENVNNRWEIGVCLSPDEELEHVSFVNGIYTFKGGKHVDYVATHIARKLQNYVAKGYKRKKLDLKQEHIKKNLWLFIRSTVEDPSFDSQTKEYLTTISSKFGSKCEVSDKFIEKLAKTGIVEKTQLSSTHT